MSQLWDRLHQLFDTNDGSLPSIRLSNLNVQEVERIYLYLRSQSETPLINSQITIQLSKSVRKGSTKSIASLREY
jgi:hypothetical protein